MRIILSQNSRFKVERTKNQCFIAYGNTAGDQYGSGSMVVDPEGEVIANISEPKEKLVAVGLKTADDKYRLRVKINGMLACRPPRSLREITENGEY